MCIKSNDRIPYSPLSLNSHCSSGKQTDCRTSTNREIKKDKRVSMCLIPSCLSMRYLCRWVGGRRWQLPYRTASHARQHPLMREKTPLVSWELIDPNSNTPSQLITLPLFWGGKSLLTPQLNPTDISFCAMGQENRAVPLYHSWYPTWTID